MKRARSNAGQGPTRVLEGLVPLLLLAPGLATALPADPPASCRAEAEEPIAVSLATPGARYPRRFSGTLEAFLPAAGLRPGRLTVRMDESDRVEVVEYLFPDDDIAFPVGKRLHLAVEQVAGFPSYYGITIADERGLLLAAASDSEPGRAVLRDGVAGFEVRFGETSCLPRSAGGCYDQITNLPLEIRRGTSTLVLMQGEAGQIEGFRARCLAAQRVVYSDRCADAGLVTLSYLIVRSDLLD